MIAERVDETADEFRVGRDRVGEPLTQVIDHPRTVGGHGDVGFVEQPRAFGARVRVAQIEAPDLFAAMPLARTGELRRRITFEIERRHDTDHRRTIVAEDHRAQRAGEPFGEIEDAQPGEDAAHG